LSLTFVRPGELRLAQWCEFDFERDSPQWVVPLGRMKMRNRDGATDHLVPLSLQAVVLLKNLRPITDRGPDSYVFPSLRPGRPLSENTLAMALRSLDVDTKSEHCPHGFRASASSMLHELGWDSDVIEAQLAHARRGVGGIYNRSHRLPERTLLMQAWGNYIDALKGGAKVTAIHA
jgi:integrase